ncbi:MAG: hypothetical protein LCH62_21060, partial [Proteobacteria bacterium]|nr:hypothetical protein [Pseudomonadota bacterium]
MAFDACIAAVREASGGKLSDADAEALISKIDRRLRALEAEGAVDDANARLAQAAREAADEAAIETALKAKHAALNVLKRVELDKRIEGYLGRLNEVQSIKALLHGTTHAVEGGRYSVQAIRQALEARFVGGVTAKLAADDRRHIVRLLRDEAFLDDVVREMAERREGGMPGKTRNGDARFLSEALAESFEASRVALNARGANIGKLDGWAGPQRHDPRKLVKSGQDAWVRAAMGRLDLKRSFPEATPEEIPDILGEVWTNIVTGRDRAETAAQRGDFTGPANLARSLERHRVLHFKDAESWLDYRREFGEGHIWDAFVTHQNHAARAGALMDVFGPNPEAMLRSIADALESRVRSRADIPGQKRASLINDLKLEQGGLAAAFSVASGRSSTPVNYGRAAIYQAIRDAQSFGKLMGAVISSAGDLVTKAVALTHNGVPIGRAYADQILELLKGRGTGEARQIAFLAGEGYDGIIGHIASGYAEDALPGTFSRLVERGFRYSGLTWWTDANKAGMARMLSAQLGQNVALDHARLPDEVGRTLAAHAIGERHVEIGEIGLRIGGVVAVVLDHGDAGGKVENVGARDSFFGKVGQ